MESVFRFTLFLVFMYVCIIVYNYTHSVNLNEN